MENIDSLEEVLFDKKSCFAKESGYEECACEKARIILNPESYWVCESCGLEYGRCYIASNKTGERRTYNNDQVMSRKITAIDTTTYGPRTEIGNHSDINNLSPHMRSLVSRMKKAQRYGFDSMELNYKHALAVLNYSYGNVNLNNVVKETAWKIYSRFYKEKIMKKSIESIVSASVYTAIRIHKVPIILEDLIKNCKATLNDVNRDIRLIVNNILPKMGLKYISPSPVIFIPRFVSELGLSGKIIYASIEIYKKAKINGLKFSGKDPKGYAGASIYLAANDLKEKVSQKHVSEITNLSEVTIRNRIRELKNLI